MINESTPLPSSEDGIVEEALFSTTLVASEPSKSQLAAERTGNEKLQSTFDELKKVKEDVDAERLKYLEDMQTMQKKQNEGNALLLQLLAAISR